MDAFFACIAMYRKVNELTMQGRRKREGGGAGGGGGLEPPPNNFYLYKAEQNTQTCKMRT